MSFERQSSAETPAADHAVSHPKAGASSLAHEHGREPAPSKVGARSLTERLPIQAKASMAGAAGAPDEATGGGAPLPDSIRASMESSFGADFGSVRVHEGKNAAAFGAIAYAQAENLHFQPGAFNPSSHSGRELIGHELAHVVQQREGRVAQAQGKGDPINADASLEAEADAQGARAARGEPAGNAASAGHAPAGAPVQRKIVYDGNAKTTDDQIISALGALGVFGKGEALLRPELATKPKQMQDKLKTLKIGDHGFLEKIVKAWHAASGDHAYGGTEPEGERLLKDSFKNFLHTEHNWRNIGVAQYMTGDATGLAIAPLVDPNVTIDVITGQQKTGLQGPTFVNGGKLPGYFAGAEGGGNVTMTPHHDNHDGTQTHYAKTFNPHVNKNPQPWNKETWEATQVIGDAYKDPTKRETVKSQLQMGNSADEQEAKTKIAEYKKTKLDPQIGGKPCVFLWGRKSGEKGGAHKELDSHAQMLIQIATKIRSDFPGHMIMLVGDPVITVNDLTQARIVNQTMALGEFWNDGEYGKYMKDRNAQRHLFELFSQDNQAVSIGMRSGSLEGMALLGLRVVFIDDQGNNAEGRMEMWSGTGAHERGKLMRDGVTDDKLDEHEEQTKGPMETYKRVGTMMTLGDQVDVRSDVLIKGAARIKTLLSEVDFANHPICPAKGNTTGDGLLATAFGAVYDDNLMAGKMPTKEAVAGKKTKTPADLSREFTTKLEIFMKSIGTTSYQDKPEVKPTSFTTAASDVEIMEKAIERDLPADPQGKAALDRLTELRSTKDLSSVLLVGEQVTSPAAGKLFGNLLKNAKGKKVTSVDAQTFVASFDKVRGSLPGKEIEQARFTKSKIDGVQLAITTLQSNNVLQPDELEQISYLTKSLGKTRS